MSGQLRVLFVDDEPRVLEGIERMLFDVADGWEIHLAEDGDAALGLLAQQEFAVVISDMRMPGMDGAALLEQVRHLHPATVRVILSGQTDERSARRALRVAHRFLSKPCSGANIVEVLRRAERMNSVIASPSLRAAIASVDQLPTPAATYYELTALLADEGASIQAIMALVRRDPALTAKVLQIANSAMFARGAAATADLQGAVLVLGTRLLSSLALAEGAFSHAGRGASAPALAAMQARALRAAHAAWRLAHGSEDREAAFSGALLAEVGRLLLVGTETEREVRDMDEVHPSVGAYLLSIWGLPDQVVDAVATHRRANLIPDQGAWVSAVVHTCMAIAHGESPDARLVRCYCLDLSRLDQGDA
ncbi:MAG: HDOD domain-containing protein [Polyangiales bacterium]